MFNKNITLAVLIITLLNSISCGPSEEEIRAIEEMKRNEIIGNAYNEIISYGIDNATEFNNGHVSGYMSGGAQFSFSGSSNNEIPPVVNPAALEKNASANT